MVRIFDHRSDLLATKLQHQGPLAEAVILPRPPDRSAPSIRRRLQRTTNAKKTDFITAPSGRRAPLRQAPDAGQVGGRQPPRHGSAITIALIDREPLDRQSDDSRASVVMVVIRVPHGAGVLCLAGGLWWFQRPHPQIQGSTLQWP